MSVTPTGQPDKEGSDKNVGNPDTTLDDIILESHRVIESPDTTLDDIILESHRVIESDNRLIHAVWNLQGVDLWHRTAGRRGLSIDEAERAMVANVQAYTAKAVREELERLKQEADTYLWSHATGQEVVRAVELYVIDAHIEQLKQEGGDHETN